MNIVILGAIIIQVLIAKASRIAGAVVGFLITTGILLWGLGAYTTGSVITLFGVRLSQPVFLLVCLVWYGFDAAEFVAAKKQHDAATHLTPGNIGEPPKSQEPPSQPSG
jgi:hypothetical protein